MPGGGCKAASCPATGNCRACIALIARDRRPVRRLALPAGNSGIACRQSLVCSLSDAATAITHTLPLPLPTAAAAATAAATVAALLTPDTCSGSLAVAAAPAGKLVSFSHLHWLTMHAAAGLAAAAPGLALELGLLTAALLPSRRGASTGRDSDNTIFAGDIARLAAGRMHAHHPRYVVPLNTSDAPNESAGERRRRCAIPHNTK